MTQGIVREWHKGDGWGIIDSAETPNGCWAHFSAIETHGYRELLPGTAVLFDFEPGPQDGYNYRATRIQTPDLPTTPRHTDTSTNAGSYHSELDLDFDLQ